MFLYFFDIDDTICNTKELIQKFLKNIPSDITSKNEIGLFIEEEIYKYGIENMELLNNSTTNFLKLVLSQHKDNVFYITARDGKYKEDTIKWLKKHDLAIPKERIFFNTEGKKGQIINEILETYEDKKFAIFFDDLLDNHEEASKYKNILTVLPTTLNVKLDLPY